MSSGASAGSGFQVVMSDLDQAAGKFRSQATDLKGAMPANGIAPVDGGSWVINDALSEILQTIGMLHTQFAGVLDSDGSNLQATYQEYRNAEDSGIKGASTIVNPSQVMKGGNK
jgi:hypothetical protein